MTADDTQDTVTYTPDRRLRAALLAAVLLVAAPLAMTAAGAAQPAPDLPAEPAFLIDLEPDGTAQATLTVTFDLTTDAERNAFESVRANGSARDDRIGRFASRMRTIAARAEANAGREMRITEPAVRFVERGDIGIVALSVTWEGLAARSGEALVLREPFASGFTLDRPFVVRAPDGYIVESATPEPAVLTDTEVTMAAGSDLDGFRVEVVEAQASNGVRTGGQSGFGIAAAVVAILAAVGMLVGRGDR